jgi:hypothetical protein
MIKMGNPNRRYQRLLDKQKQMRHAIGHMGMRLVELEKEHNHPSSTAETRARCKASHDFLSKVRLTTQNNLVRLVDAMSPPKTNLGSRPAPAPTAELQMAS